MPFKMTRIVLPKGFLAGLLKRKKKTKSAEYALESPPPPIPPKLPPSLPKYKGSFDASIPRRSRMLQDNMVVRHRRSRSMSDFTTVSHLDYRTALFKRQKYCLVWKIK